MAAKRKNKPAKVKRALKDRAKGGQSSPHDLKPKILSSKVERRQVDTTGLQQGKVIAIEGRTYYVETVGSDTSKKVLECVPSRSVATENPNSTLIAVGDNVWFRTGDTDDTVGIIQLIEERKTKLARRAAGSGDMEQVIGANIDQLIIVVSVDEPRYKKSLIDRYLVAARKGKLEPAICINKIDLGDEEKVKRDLQFYYDRLEIPVYFISAADGRNIEHFTNLVRDKTSVLSGPSGAGKSTIINVLFGKDVQVTADTKKKFRKGQHITTFARMFTLPQSGYILDTPGIREFGIWDVSRDELPAYFHEFNDYADACKFPNCTHTHEPQCAVKEALDSGELDTDRYNNYVRLLNSLQN